MVIRHPRIVLTTRLIIAFALVACSVVLFAKIAVEVRSQETLPFDRAVLMAINHHATPFWNTVMPVATDIGGAVGISLFLTFLLTYFAKERRYDRIILVSASVGGAAILNLLLKAIFERARPNLWVQLIHETGYSFPSGHAMMSAALGLSVVVALWYSRWRWWACSLATAYIAFVGYARLYLAVHYPTDVLGGWCVSAAWVLVVAIIMHFYAAGVSKQPALDKRDT